MLVTPEVKAAPKFARQLRQRISDLFGLPHPDRIILTPGILVGLRLWFSGVHVRQLLVTTSEYHRASHFPELSVKEADVSKFVARAVRFRPDAALASLVTWNGSVLPVRDVFRRMRSELGAHRPRLIADCTHAGAIGFPRLDRTGADIVSGDLCKWITPLEYQRNLAFLWFANKTMAETARRIFNPFFLATENQTLQPVARWIEPKVVHSVLEQLSASKMKRENVASRHSANIQMAHLLSKRFGLTKPPESSIVWLGTPNRRRKTTSDLEKQGLVWRPRGGGVRILCRSEEYVPGLENGRRVLEPSSLPDTDSRRFETIEVDDGGVLAI